MLGHTKRSYPLAVLSRVATVIEGVRHRSRILLGTYTDPALLHPLDNISPRLFWARRYLSLRYVRGNGLEIGALHQPLSLYMGAKARYLDRQDTAELRRHYPELGRFPLIEPDIIGNGETLEAIPPQSLDFIVANHFIEHCEDPFGVIRNHLQRLRPNGILFMAVPNKLLTFDRECPLTQLQHLIDDYHHGPGRERWAHFEEWTRFVEKAPGEKLAEKTQELIDRDYSIHYHVWSPETFLEHLIYLKEELRFPFEILSRVLWKHNPFETIFVLRKTS